MIDDCGGVGGMRICRGNLKYLKKTYSSASKSHMM
jgi:hypothetical protein